jgi:N-succinyldiaminopimelate aminotransferase
MERRTHVIENRAKYGKNSAMSRPCCNKCWTSHCRTPASTYGQSVDKLAAISDIEFAKRLYAEYNVTVLPGSYLAREAHGVNPGRNRIRMALVAEVDECLEAANRIVEFCKKSGA